MKLRNTAITTFLVLATCADGTQPESAPTAENTSTVESSKAALGKIPPSEVAQWQKVGSSNTPSSRYLHAAAFDEARKVVVVFGGISGDLSSGSPAVNQDTWEWSPATGKWTNRTTAGAIPDSRSGAAMVYDSIRAKLILFGGRAGSGSNLEDTWEWDPTTGVWTDVGASGHPSARSQHAMVFEKSTGKVLLFGGGRSATTSADGTGISISMADTWEYDPTAKTWTARTVTASPSMRNDSALVWDSSTNKAVLFGGIQVDIANAAGVPKQDTWEWDPTAGTWTERTRSGSKPSQRYGHAMAFDGTRKKVVVFGGWDIATGSAKNDLWEWDDTTGAWTQRLSGSEAGVPVGRMYATMVSDDARDRLVVVAGAILSGYVGPGGTGGYYGGSGGYYGSSGGDYGSSGGYYGSSGGYYGSSGGSIGEAAGSGSPNGPVVVMNDLTFYPAPCREVWELDPVTPAFSNVTPPLGAPSNRYSPAVAFNPVTGKTCLFGGSDISNGTPLDDYWEWDGTTWTQPTTAGTRPPARAYGAMAFDSTRKSLILYGGTGMDNGVNGGSGMYGDTWELNAGGTWVRLTPASNPGSLMAHAMVTDTARNKILLFGGMGDYYSQPIMLPNPSSNRIWEWDGAAGTWTDRTPPDTTNVPTGRTLPALAYDEGRQKLFLFDGGSYGSSASSFSEWDSITGGWASRDAGGDLNYLGNTAAVAYDSVRRRAVILSGVFSNAGVQQTWEIDTVAPTLYVRETSSAPLDASGGSMAFDGKRGVIVFVGFPSNTYTSDSPLDTWEYRVTGWGNGEGCTAATASQCASGFCVDGVCCDVAACTGACKSCNVAGSEGTCVLTKAGTEVAGSCDAGKACDGTGGCKVKNSLACTTNGECASGFCVDGVCCDSACTGACVSCNQTGRLGKCTPYQAGTDPQGECGEGEGACKSTCDGAGNCAFPQYTVPCGNCLTCNGLGSCSSYDFTCTYPGRPDGGPVVPPPIRLDGGPYPVDALPDVGPISFGGTGGNPGLGGAGGRNTGLGGAGGYPIDGPRSTGTGGSIPSSDGSAGTTPRTDGSAGAPGNGGAAGNLPRSDGSAGSIPSTGSGGVGIAGAGGAGGSPFGVGGSSGTKPIASPDGSVGDADVNLNLHKSGCSCEVGQSRARALGVGPFLFATLAILLARRRRSRS
jgi:hypothetical protein